MSRRVLAFVFSLLVLGSAPLKSQQTGQEFFIRLVDASAANSPLEIKGDIVASYKPTQELRYSGRLSVTNVSSKPMLLTIVSLKGTNVVGVNETSAYDYYFSEWFGPQTTENRDWTLGPFLQRTEVKTENGLKWVDVEPIKGERQEVIVSVLFVQYADGTSWGDREAAREALAAREETTGRLRALASVYRDEGEQVFLDSLMQPSKLTAIVMLQYCGKNSDDKSQVVERLFRMLSNAEEHERLIGLR